MNNIRSFILSFLLLLFCCNSFCQISHGGTPTSFSLPNKQNSFSTDSVNINLNELQQLRDLECDIGCAKQIGFFINSHTDCEKSLWKETANGEMIYIISFYLNDAKAVGIYFSNLSIPENTKMFIYNADKSELLGSFNQSNILFDNSFSTQAIPGNIICLEFNSTKDYYKELNFSIGGFSYFFDANFLNYSGSNYFRGAESCQVNINCPEGNSVKEQANAIVKLVILGSNKYYLCSGTMLNNTAQDRTPYLLSAWHCASNTYTSQEYAHWQFYFSYELPLCEGSQTPPQNKTLIGCTHIASASFDYPGGSDFLLIKLLDSVIPADYNPYFAGWSAENKNISNAKCVHHPSGDVKKVSSSDNVYPSNWPYSGSSKITHLKVQWKQTQNGYGTTEGGSSGAPLLDEQGLVVGTLTGGESSCDKLLGNDYFGMFSYSWNKNDPTGNNQSKRLNTWLDPVNTGATYLQGFSDGLYLGQLLYSFDNSSVYSNNSANILSGTSIKFKTTFFGNPDSCLWSFQGAIPNTSTEFEPDNVTYNNIGNYSVKLILYKRGLAPKEFVFNNFVNVVANYYPNPFDNKIVIVFPQNINNEDDNPKFKEIRLINLQGQIVAKPNLTSYQYNKLTLYFDNDNINEGIYILQLISKNDTVNIKVIKQK